MGDQDKSWEEQSIEEDAMVTVVGVTYFEHDGSYYEGERDADGKRHGHGKATFPDLPWIGDSQPDRGIVYEGEFQDDNVHGKGKFMPLVHCTLGYNDPIEGEWHDYLF